MANVSICTASKIINQAKGWDLYTEDCVKRVQEASRALGYKPNYHAIALKAGRSQAIGMVMAPLGQNQMHTPFNPGVLMGVDAGAVRSGYHFIAINPGSESDQISNALKYLREGRVDGLVVVGSVLDESPSGSIENLENWEYPIALINYEKETKLPVIGIDHAGGIRKAMDHLAELGHQCITYVGPRPNDVGPAALRHDAFHSSVRERQIESHEILYNDPDFSRVSIGDFIATVRRVLLDDMENAERNATAILCYNEATALAAYAAMQSLGKSIPEDISIVGFDDIFAPLAWPPMTVVSHMLEAIGQEAIRIIIEMAGDNETWNSFRNYREKIEPELVIRESTAAPGA